MDSNRESVPATWANWIVAALGIWLIIAPWVVGFSGSGAADWDNVLVGIVVIIAALMAAQTDHSGPSWWNVALGIWMVVSPFILGYGFMTGAVINDVVCGVLIAIIALSVAVTKMPGPRMRAPGA